MNNSFINTILPYFLPVLGTIGAGIATAAGIMMNKWITMMKVKATIQNGGIAVQAIEQM